jgi:hypothetical protein
MGFGFYFFLFFFFFFGGVRWLVVISLGSLERFAYDTCFVPPPYSDPTTHVSNEHIIGI